MSDNRTSKERLLRFLHRFEHLRVMDEDEGSESCDIVDLIDGKEVTVGYARSQSEVDAFNRLFREARDLLKRPPSETPASQWEVEAQGTLERLSRFLQKIGAPYAVDWREWIDNAEKHLLAKETIEMPAPLDEKFFAALDICGTQEPLEVYDSNSWRRIGLARRYEEVIIPERQRVDGHLNISNTNLLRALVAAFNAMLARRAEKTAVHADPTGTTREMPHCPSCSCAPYPHKTWCATIKGKLCDCNTSENRIREATIDTVLKHFSEVEETVRTAGMCAAATFIRCAVKDALNGSESQS
jgi:hypothetical protein